MFGPGKGGGVRNVDSDGCMRTWTDFQNCVSVVCSAHKVEQAKEVKDGLFPFLGNSVTVQRDVLLLESVVSFT